MKSNWFTKFIRPVHAVTTTPHFRLLQIDSALIRTSSMRCAIRHNIYRWRSSIHPSYKLGRWCDVACDPSIRAVLLACSIGQACSSPDRIPLASQQTLAELHQQILSLQAATRYANSELWGTVTGFHIYAICCCCRGWWFWQYGCVGAVWSSSPWR